MPPYKGSCGRYKQRRKDKINKVDYRRKNCSVVSPTSHMNQSTQKEFRILSFLFLFNDRHTFPRFCDN